VVDRLSVLDASLLEMDTPRSPMHTGGIGIFEPGLRLADVHQTLRARLAKVRHARQRLRDSGPGAGRPVWIDDVDFDLSYHLRHAALPEPGTREQLGDFLARLIERPLDRARPLWEIYVVEGLEGDRTCVFRKVHLVMAGGERGDPFGVLLDDKPDFPRPAGAQPDRWQPRVPPRTPALLAESMRERLALLGEVRRGVAAVARDPGRLVDLSWQAAGSALGVAGRLVRQAPRSPLNSALTEHRRFATAGATLEDLRRVRRAFGGSINDVVVAVIGDAVGRLLRSRGHETKDLDLQVMVPVRVHGADADALDAIGSPRTIGEGVVGVVVPLPVMEMDPIARLYRVMGELAGLKESRQAVAADNLVRLVGFAPPTLHALAARLASAEQRYNLALSNAPGPQEPRYLAGRRMQEIYPFIPLAGDSALSVAVTSYSGGVYYGLLGDRVALPDIDALTGFVQDAIATLSSAAESVGA
jgi:diacylglycerol O-acyltransferase / wax synthase